MTHRAGPGRGRAARHVAIIAALLAAGGCVRHVAPVQPVSHLHYEVGAPWNADGVWHYPCQDFAFHDTGLAVTDAPSSAPRLTADGEVYNPAAMTGAHPTLQLPVMVIVRNLENGRIIRIRLNDRGPVQKGRMISLTPAAARWLGMTSSEPARVEVTEDLLASREWAETLPGNSMPEMSTAPVGTVLRQSLDTGAPQTPAVLPQKAVAGTVPAITDGPPATAMQGLPSPGALWIDTGHFTNRRAAEAEAAKAGAVVRHTAADGDLPWAVRLGPFMNVRDADAALDRTLAAGLTGAHIIVE